MKRFTVFVKSNAEVESGVMPLESDLDTMTRFNDRLVEAGALLAAEGLHASANGARLVYNNGDVSVRPGPFADPESLVAGYWVIQARSLEDAIALMKPAPMGEGAVLEIRQVAEADDFGEAFTPELHEREERQRVRMEANARRGPV